MAFTCPRCGATSHHPRDEQERYCGRCHLFVDDCHGRKPILSDGTAKGWTQLEFERALLALAKMRK